MEYSPNEIKITLGDKEIKDYANEEDHRVEEYLKNRKVKSVLDTPSDQLLLLEKGCMAGKKD